MRIKTEKRKASSLQAAYLAELNILLKLDEKNQQEYAKIVPTRRGLKVASTQLYLLTESIFLRAFCAYEEFLEELFVYFCRGKETLDGHRVKSYIGPRNASHARDIIKSNMRYLEWSNPDDVIRRADIYLENGSPIKFALTTYRSSLQDAKCVRNAIAHRSHEAREKYASCVRRQLQVPPLTLPEPGEFLLMKKPGAGLNYFLVIYFEIFKKMGEMAVARQIP